MTELRFRVDKTAQRARIRVIGIVQGVGFRPFVYTLARSLGIVGWVRNTSSGVDIAAQGEPVALGQFLERLESAAPPLAQIEEIHSSPQAPGDFTSFEILPSTSRPGELQPIPQDVGLCADCLRELRDPQDLRFRYPFTNCTNCGPRFTIITDIPYDRPNTTMAGFKLCPQCSREYHDPQDRRFHAQPVACPKCGPGVWLESSRESGPLQRQPADYSRKVRTKDEAAIQLARRQLALGAVVAIKGLGGFHLACDATNADAVARLRARKLRVDKPFALMMPDCETVAAHCVLSDCERNLLESPMRPVVILERRPDSCVAPEVAPNQSTLGVMLPYTPLHYLLLEPGPGLPQILVMTSGNLSEEPIATGNREARRRLAGLADYFLLHDRPIHTRCDDSVVRCTSRGPYPLRRARGYAPTPLLFPWDSPPILATGSELKNTFCLVKDRHAILSHHIGDMENYETLKAFEQGIEHYERLFRIAPQALAYDLHPDYLANRYALGRSEESGLPAIGVQHHHAHIAACLAEHRRPLEQRVIGVSFDGTGYGTDGHIWGGEFLIAGYARFDRAAHLAYVPMPGGEAAVREPWRMALAWLHAAGLDWDSGLAPVKVAGPRALAVIERQLEAAMNTPFTSSVGRLFDAAASLTGLRQRVNYEAQAAIELEAQIDPHEEGSYPFDFDGGVIDAQPMWRQLVTDLGGGVPAGRISARFHNGVADMVVEVCGQLERKTGLGVVVLSGGVWQNVYLLERTTRRLEGCGFEVLTHRLVPANDGGVAFGQAAVASATINGGPAPAPPDVPA